MSSEELFVLKLCLVYLKTLLQKYHSPDTIVCSNFMGALRSLNPNAPHLTYSVRRDLISLFGINLLHGCVYGTAINIFII